jgi:hypothetical protein
MQTFEPSWVKDNNFRIVTGGAPASSSSSSAVGWGNTWYPNVPAVMRVDKSGQLVTMSETWLKKGFGIPRDGCTLMDAWNGWMCPSARYTRLIIENMDKDHEIRRVSPVALSSDGYTNILNGCMDHGDSTHSFWVHQHMFSLALAPSDRCQCFSSLPADTHDYSLECMQMNGRLVLQLHVLEAPHDLLERCSKGFRSSCTFFGHKPTGHAIASY